MKKFFCLSLSSILLLSSNLNSVFANEKFNSNIKSKIGIHHYNNYPISGNGYVNYAVNIKYPEGKDYHNRVKVHFYNRSFEPVTVRFDGESMNVKPWSGNSFTTKTNEGVQSVTIIGLNDNSNQKLSG